MAVEWINRLRNLIFYWQYRHRVDANQEIELAQATRPRLTPQTRVHDVNEEAPPEPPIDLSMPYPAMSRLYNWCVLEGCRPIVKGGRLYMKKGLRGQFKSVDTPWLSFFIILITNTDLSNSIWSPATWCDSGLGHTPRYIQQCGAR